MLPERRWLIPSSLYAMSDARFNLETAIATWRRFLLSERSISSEDADELESHLRDEIDEAVGLEPDAAFRQAVRRLGDYALLERSYRRVYWKKVRSEHRVTDELRWRLSMLKNYLKIVLRHTRRHKGYTFINVSGLAMGIACCLFILLYVQDEIRYDRYHENAEPLCRRVYWKKVRSEHRVTDELRWRLSMLKNYLKIVLRHTRRHKGYTFINVSGLAMGIACCLFILLFVQDEIRYDRYHENADRIVRLVEDLHTVNQTLYQATSAPAMGPNLLKDYPEVLQAVRVVGPTDHLLQYGDKRFQENTIVYADSTVFEVFDFFLVRGDPKTALIAPHSVVLTESVARKYFGDADPLGKTMTLENDQTLTVTGLLGEIPRTSHLFFDIMLSFTTLEGQYGNINENWGWNVFYTYLLLPEGADPALLEGKLPDFLERHIGDWLRSRGFSYTLHLQPLTSRYVSKTTRRLPLLAFWVRSLAPRICFSTSCSRSQRWRDNTGISMRIGAGTFSTRTCSCRRAPTQRCLRANCPIFWNATSATGCARAAFHIRCICNP